MDLFHVLRQVLYLNAPEIMLLVAGAVCCQKVNIIHGFLMTFVLYGVICPKQAIKKITLNVISMLVVGLVLAKMLYQTKFFHHYDSRNNCSHEMYPLEVSLVFDPNWFGFDTKALPSTVEYFAILALGTIFRAIEFYTFTGNVTNNGVIFSSVSRSDFDESIAGAFTFMINYGFHKFGVEICKISMAALIISRDDVFGVVYGIGLLGILTLSRKNLKRVWWFMQTGLAYCIIHQYIVALAAFPSFCLDFFGSIDGTLRKWLFLYHNTRIDFLPVGDIFILLLFSKQGKVFMSEDDVDHPAGSNQEIFKLFSAEYKNTIYDHTTYCRHGIDYLKAFLFYLPYWGCILVCFAIGGNGSSFLSLTYLIIAFCIIWGHAALVVWKVNRLRKWLNAFMVYAVLCMVIKSAFSLMCFANYGLFNSKWRIIVNSVCGGKPNLFLDLCAFAFMLLLRRFIESNYFLHYVKDIKVTMALEIRGAALFMSKSREKIERDEKRRAETVNKIKADMAIIREYNRRINVVEPSTHEEAILSGNYIMFEDIGRPGGSEDKDGPTLFGDFKFKENLVDPILNFPDISNNENLQKWQSGTSRFLKLYEMLKCFVKRSMQVVIQFLNHNSRDFRFIAWAINIEKAQLKILETSDLIIPTVIDFKRSENKKSMHVAFQLMDAVWFTLLDYSELACYLAVFVLQGLAPTLLSLPIPLMVLLWGSLTVRHPSPTFWTTLITYTGVVMVLKAVFKISAFSWASDIQELRVFGHYSPNIIGLTEITPADLFLLVMLYIHRKKLKTFGLWSNTINEPSNPKRLAKRKLTKYFEPFTMFLEILRYGQSPRLPIDIYTYSFICEVSTFIIIFIGFSSFVPQTSYEDQVFYVVENKVPVSYLIAIIFQFLVILIDRALYLKNWILGKFVMHVVFVIMSHVWLFAIMPFVTLRRYNDLVWPQVWYTFKYVSFLLSAYQLRNGYPTRLHNNFLSKTHNRFSLNCFRTLKFFPFFFPLRHIIDWMCTKTSLTCYEWFQFESIKAIIFEVKCFREIEKRDPSLRGVACKSKLKLGGVVLAALFFLIWAPLILFAFFNTVAVPDPPIYAVVSFQINNYLTLYSAELREDEILPLTQKGFQNLRTAGGSGLKNLPFLEQYDFHDVSVIELQPVSRSLWDISSAHARQIINDAKLNKTFVLHLRFVLHRRESKMPYEGSSGDFSFPFDEKTRTQFSDALERKNEPLFRLTQKFPVFFESKNGIVSAIGFNKGFQTYRNVSLVLNNMSNDWWWMLLDDSLEKFKNGLQDDLDTDVSKVAFYVFCEKRIPGVFQYLSTRGIIGMYVSAIIVVWGLIRTATSQMHLHLRFYSLPKVDSIYQLCSDVYLARESGELALEEDLYAKLLFLFRSPETMIKWTKPESQQLEIDNV